VPPGRSIPNRDRGNAVLVSNKKRTPWSPHRLDPLICLRRLCSLAPLIYATPMALKGSVRSSPASSYGPSAGSHMAASPATFNPSLSGPVRSSPASMHLSPSPSLNDHKARVAKQPWQGKAGRSLRPGLASHLQVTHALGRDARCLRWADCQGAFLPRSPQEEPAQGT
jgi:hypothetical protein